MDQDSLSHLLRRFLWVGVSSLSIAIAAEAHAQPDDSTLPLDRTAPLEFRADSLEHAQIEGGRQRLTLSGNVEVTQGKLQVSSDDLTANYPPGPMRRPDTIQAQGGVRIQHGDLTIECEEALVDNNTCLATCSGGGRGARLTRGDSSLSADKITADLCKKTYKAINAEGQTGTEPTEK